MGTRTSPTCGEGTTGAMTRRQPAALVSKCDGYSRANRPYSAKWRSKAMASVMPSRSMTTKLMASQSE
jgi:hypothetical protein